MKTHKEYPLGKQLKGLRYHSDEADGLLQEISDITGWEFRPLSQTENIQYDKEAQKGESLYQFFISFVHHIRDWTNEVLMDSHKENSDVEEKNEKPVASQTILQENHLKICYEELTEHFQWTIKGKKKRMRNRLQDILYYIDECEISQSKLSEKGNSFSTVKENIEETLQQISRILNHPKIPSVLLAKLERIPNSPSTIKILANIQGLKKQMTLWELQEKCATFRSHLYDSISDYGQFSPDRGIFEDVINELLSDTDIPEKLPAIEIFLKQMSKLGIIIVNLEKFEGMYVTFRALCRAHYYKVAFERGIPKDNIDAILL